MYILGEILPNICKNFETLKIFFLNWWTLEFYFQLKVWGSRHSWIGSWGKNHLKIFGWETRYIFETSSIRSRLYIPEKTEYHFNCFKEKETRPNWGCAVTLIQIWVVKTAAAAADSKSKYKAQTKRGERVGKENFGVEFLLTPPVSISGTW